LTTEEHSAEKGGANQRRRVTWLLLNTITQIILYQWVSF